MGDTLAFRSDGMPLTIYHESGVKLCEQACILRQTVREVQTTHRGKPH